MKKASLFLLLISPLLHSCSCIPTSSQLLGTFKLKRVQSESSNVDYKDSTYYFNVGLLEVNEVMRLTESFIINGDTLSQDTWAMEENPDECKNTNRKRVIVTYANGDKRRIIRDASDPMNVKLELSEVYQGNNVPDFPVYCYVEVE
ncbi:MAG: hypothetical protein AB8F74_19805 [Saprospiraceae bacterium]